ncbi:MAG TPA: lysine--tRNA ligase [Lentisphaeria bacterium]|nr:lysine--tRNA ligase [Lentisphaeria bacterium]HCG48670.1 lysine--tRNA ligase [Lentisphaeria bacterium]
MSEENVQNTPEQKPEDIFAQRAAKVQDLAAAGILPFGRRFDNVQMTADVRKNFKPEAEKQEEVTIAGRMTAFRAMGKSIFADIKDSSGRMQIYVQRDQIGEDDFKVFKKLDLGDIIGVTGEPFTTRTGELTVKVHKFTLLSKSLRPLPEKFHGLTDIEQRYRQRYLDLITNDDSRKVFMQRFAILSEIRKFLASKGFLEVETPMLQPIPGGANANPFKTFYEALNSPMYMRIAPELYLKRLLVGGFERVFELNRNFRNEGIDRRHNPEFTMLEIYQAYGDCRSMMDLIEEMVTTIAMNLFGTLEIQHPGGKVINLARPWRRAPYRDLIKERAGADWFDLDKEQKAAKAREMGLTITTEMEERDITHEIYEKLIEQTLIQPTFVTRLPAYLVPLAKACEDDPTVVDVYELEINGQEISPGYSELNDPIEQRKRFVEQAVHDGKDLAMAIDEDFLTAMEHGMPPAGGLGLGVDRLIMLLTGAESIRDVLLFPQMRLKQ